jgi:hypothetical protein
MPGWKSRYKRRQERNAKIREVEADKAPPPRTLILRDGEWIELERAGLPLPRRPSESLPAPWE